MFKPWVVICWQWMAQYSQHPGSWNLNLDFASIDSSVARFPQVYYRTNMLLNKITTICYKRKIKNTAHIYYSTQQA